MADITFEIKKQIGVISDARGGWMKELNLVSWNGAAPKYDIRDWSPDHQKMGKGITLDADQARKVADILHEALAQEKGAS
jgi:hypothetical protein